MAETDSAHPPFKIGYYIVFQSGDTGAAVDGRGENRALGGLENGEIYRPSNGERGILLMQKLLDSESDVYILDEPELGMGNSYITSNILPRLTDLAKRRKTVIIATHNANIAVGTFPYISILRTHENGVYKTYIGNPFYDELRNINDETDTKNWTQESMHTLEGGKNAFYDRKDIYESGKQSD